MTADSRIEARTNVTLVASRTWVWFMATSWISTTEAQNALFRLTFVGPTTGAPRRALTPPRGIFAPRRVTEGNNAIQTPPRCCLWFGRAHADRPNACTMIRERLDGPAWFGRNAPRAANRRVSAVRTACAGSRGP